MIEAYLQIIQKFLGILELYKSDCELNILFDWRNLTPIILQRKELVHTVSKEETIVLVKLPFLSIQG